MVSRVDGAYEPISSSGELCLAVHTLRVPLSWAKHALSTGSIAWQYSIIVGSSLRLEATGDDMRAGGANGTSIADARPVVFLPGSPTIASAPGLTRVAHSATRCRRLLALGRCACSGARPQNTPQLT